MNILGVKFSRKVLNSSVKLLQYAINLLITSYKEHLSELLDVFSRGRHWRQRYANILQNQITESLEPKKTETACSWWVKWSWGDYLTRRTTCGRRRTKLKGKRYYYWPRPKGKRYGKRRRSLGCWLDHLVFVYFPELWNYEAKAVH